MDERQGHSRPQRSPTLDYRVLGTLRATVRVPAAAPWTNRERWRELSRFPGCAKRILAAPPWSLAIRSVVVPSAKPWAATLSTLAVAWSEATSRDSAFPQSVRRGAAVVHSGRHGAP